MMEVILKILPVIFIAIIGFLLKKTKLLNQDHGDVFLKVVYFVALPALILTSIPTIELSFKFILLPISSAIIIILTYFVSSFIGKKLKLSKPSLGVFIIGSMIINNGFMIPFIIAAYGAEGLGRLLIFDISNGVLAYTWVYYIAYKHGSNHHDRKSMIKKFIFSPPIWALFIAIAMNLLNIKIPEMASSLFEILGEITIPLLMITLGLYFNPKIVNRIAVGSNILVRSFGGLLIGFLLAKLFKFEGLSFAIVILSASAPIGYNSLTFASLENLDKEYAASIVSFSVLTGLVLTPILIYLLS